MILIRHLSCQNRGAFRAFFCFWAFCFGSFAPRADAAPLPSPGGWGIDACLSVFAADLERAHYLTLLDGTGIGVLRERGAQANLRELASAGHRIVAFVSLPGLASPQIGNALSEDLRAVYAAARDMAKTYPYVDAWEMVGEPDIGYCTDLPDRVVAFQKAVYLGIKRGAWEARASVERQELSVERSIRSEKEKHEGVGGGREREAHAVNSGLWTERKLSALNSQRTGGQPPLVLMGALAFPPGPWLERARRNGLLDYTDAYNFHYYGHAADLTGVVRAHARVAVRNGAAGAAPVFHKAPLLRPTGPRPADLPLWITECGMCAVDQSNFLDAERRQLQAEFTVETARQALASNRVAVFMPFILTHKDDPHALTLSADRPLPAWNAYAQFTKVNPWPARPLADFPAAPNPIVVQWLPDNATTTPHKVSGTYRFKDEPVSAENWLSGRRAERVAGPPGSARRRGDDQPGKGRPTEGETPNRTGIKGELRLYNFSEKTVRGRLQLVMPSSVSSSFATGAEVAIAAESMVVVQGEFQRMDAGYFQAWIEGSFVSDDGVQSPVYFGLEAWPIVQDFATSSLALAPLPAVQTVRPTYARYRPTSALGHWRGLNGVVVKESRSTGGAFAITELTGAPLGDPLAPPVARAAVKGLPPDGFLVLTLGQPMKPGHLVLVELIDDRGQRFSIWENFGQSYYRPAERETWLNVNDFNVSFWGHCEREPKLEPARIREIQLRFYARKVGEVFEVDLSWRTARPHR